MPVSLQNPWVGKGFDVSPSLPKTDVSTVERLLSQCPAHQETPLTFSREIAEAVGVAEVWIKDERHRMGLGSFKALGAAFVIAKEAEDAGSEDIATSLQGRTFVTASAGNHGMSVAAGARIFGATAVIYIAESVPAAFEERLKSMGARVVREGEIYEDSMTAAELAAKDNGWTLLSDSSWPGYVDSALGVMEGYLQMSAEAARQIPEPPTHILQQAGVGGLAGAVAAHARSVWGDKPTIIVVEPEAAPALIESVRAGAIVTTDGPVSSMGRLDCKTPSLVALAGLSRDANRFVTITEDEGESGVARLSDFGFDTTPSGGAGLSALLAGLDLPADARVLTFLSEGPESG
ncbi:MAG: pyridoxal-phosphate dependent enzyme [Boseongicola sp.]|nr:pyridoxal-phosphate dependent enzyme [Boseongicola sp.]